MRLHLLEQRASTQIIKDSSGRKSDGSAVTLNKIGVLLVRK